MSDLPGDPADPVGRQTLESDAQSPPPIPESGLRPRSALSVAAVSLLAQLAFGIAVGIVVGLYYGITRGSVTHQVAEEIERVVVVPAAAASMIGGGLIAFVMTRRVLPGSIGDGALRPIGWRAAKSGHLVAAVCLGVVLGAFSMFVLGRVFPPGPGQGAFGRTPSCRRSPCTRPAMRASWR